jgi:hypothetical protein
LASARAAVKFQEVESETRGTVDFRDEHFVVSCPFDGKVHAALRALPQQRYDSEEQLWWVPRHLPSVSGLLALARDREWPLTRAAMRARDELREEAALAEFRVELVRGSYDEPLFKVRVDDLDLEERVKAIPGADIADEARTWHVPAYRPEACQLLQAIVDDELRFEVDPAAQRLLDEPEEWTDFAPDAEEEPEPVHEEPPVRAPTKPTLDEVVDAFDREQELLQWSLATEAELERPPLARELAPYQVAALRYVLATRRTLLADDKGLGKSVQALAALEAAGAYPALIVCPGALKQQWLREAAEWLPGSRVAVALDGSATAVPLCDVAVIDYADLHGATEVLKARRFRAIVADESHYLASERQQRTRAALAVAESVSELRLCLTARLGLDQPVQLVPQLQFLGVLDAHFGGAFRFKERYCRPREDASGVRFGASRTDELQHRLRASCMVRRERAAVVTQRPVRCVHRVAAHGAAAALAVAVEELRGALSVVGAEIGEKQPPHVAETVREHLARALADANRRKLDGVTAWAQHFLSSGDWLCLVARQRETLDALSERFPEALCVRADGTCTLGGRPATSFLAASTHLVLCELGASGTAVRLARGRHVAFAELALDAASHAGAELLVESPAGELFGAVWYLVGEGSVDEALMRAFEQRWALRGPSERDDLHRVLDVLLRAHTPEAPPPVPSRAELRRHQF